MKRSGFSRWLAVVLVLTMGLLHIMTAQSEYEKAAYMGYLFATNFFGSLLAAFGIRYRQGWGWMLGMILAVGSFAGYVWSRTAGLPGLNVEEWFAPYGVVSLSVEGAFILLAVLRPLISVELQTTPSMRGIWKVLPSLAALAVIASAGLATRQWDLAVTRAYGHHVGSLEQVCGTPATTMDELEQKYGIRISLAAISMMGSIVDVRVKVVDPVKAHALLQNQAALLVGQQALILAPHMHSHDARRLKAGKIYVIFFPAGQQIRAGSEVSLVLGPVRVEPMVVK